MSKISMAKTIDYRKQNVIAGFWILRYQTADAIMQLYQITLHVSCLAFVFDINL